MKAVYSPCGLCKGTGKDPYNGKTCQRCKGTGYTDVPTTYPKRLKK